MMIQGYALDLHNRHVNNVLRICAARVVIPIVNCQGCAHIQLRDLVLDELPGPLNSSH